MPRTPDVHALAWLRNRPVGEKRFLLAVPAVGLATGLAAAALVHLVAFVQRAFWGSGHAIVETARGLGPLHRFGAPLVGGIIVAGILLLCGGAIRGHGTAGIIEAVVRGKSRLPVIAGLQDIAAIVVTVGSGGSLGREGSLTRAGSTLASQIGSRLGLSGSRLKVLVGCGAAAGIAAAYNAPIGGAMFAMEVILGTFALESFGPIVVASAIGTLISRTLIGSYAAYHPPAYPPPVSVWELLHYLLLGIVIGLVAAFFLVALRVAGWAFGRAPMPAWSRPILGMAIVGAIGIGFPEVFGNGYDTVDLVLRDAVPLGLVLLLPFLKVAATAITRGSGAAGGLFTPTLFIGAVSGSAYGSWCHRAFPWTTATSGAYALAGMGAMLAGTTQAPLTAILMIFELTGEYAVILPLMVCCTAAMIVCRALRFESVYTQTLVDRGVALGGRMEELVMEGIAVGDLMRSSGEPVREEDTLDVVVDRMRREGRKELFVVGADDKFLGTITLADLSEHLAHPESLATIRAKDAVYPGVPVLFRDDRLTEAIGRWAQVSRDRLPVLDGPLSRKLVGELSSGDIFTIYNQEILRKEARLARFVRTGQQSRPETTYVELPEEYVVAQVTLPEGFESVTVRTLNPRARFGINVIEIKRTLGHGQVRRIICDADTELKAGDGLIVVGRSADIAHLKDPLWMSRLLHPDAVAGDAEER